MIAYGCCEKQKHTIYSFNGSTRDSGWRLLTQQLFSWKISRNEWGAVTKQKK
jgi:hypothetical protein